MALVSCHRASSIRHHHLATAARKHTLINFWFLAFLVQSQFSVDFHSLSVSIMCSYSYGQYACGCGEDYINWDTVEFCGNKTLSAGQIEGGVECMCDKVVATFEGLWVSCFLRLEELPSCESFADFVI